MHVWDIYFSAIVSMHEHPGFNRENATRYSLEECATVADMMLAIRERRDL